jgi:AcrR family transcriptional regulator
MARDGRNTRNDILQAADELFYGEGIGPASMEAIAAKAGVTKRTLYYHFRSKDDLVAAYLETHDEPTISRFSRWLDETQGALAQQIAGVFQKLTSTAMSTKWKGCGFLRTSAELANSPGHPALKVAASHKKKFESLLAERIAAEGLCDPPLRARQIMIILDGAVCALLLHRDPSYGDAAGLAASALLTNESRDSETVIDDVAPAVKAMRKVG